MHTWSALAAPAVPTRFSRSVLALMAVTVALANAVLIVQALNLYHALALGSPVARGLALRHGAQLFALERTLHLAVEPGVQRLLASGVPTPLGTLPGALIHRGLVWVYLHAFPAWLFAALAWSYAYRRHYFPRLRDLTIISTLLAVACYRLFPVAPPRFVLAGSPYNLHDWTYGGTSVDPHVVQIVGFNPYAAFPSVHLLAALIPALCVARGSRSVWVWISALCFPLLMAITVIGTGNHYVLDCIGSLLILALGAAIARGIDQVRRQIRAALGHRGKAPPYELPSALSLCLCCAGFLAVVGRPGGPRILIAAAIVLAVVFATGRSPYLWQGRRRIAQGRQPLWCSDYVAGLLFIGGASAATQPLAPLQHLPSPAIRALWLLACMSALARHVRVSGVERVACRRHGAAGRYLPALRRRDAADAEDGEQIA